MAFYTTSTPTGTSDGWFRYNWIAPDEINKEPEMKPDVQFEIVIDGATALTKDGPEIEKGKVSLRVRFNHDDETWVATLPMVKETD